MGAVACRDGVLAQGNGGPYRRPEGIMLRLAKLLLLPAVIATAFFLTPAQAEARPQGRAPAAHRAHHGHRGHHHRHHRHHHAGQHRGHHHPRHHAR